MAVKVSILTCAVLAAFGMTFFAYAADPALPNDTNAKDIKTLQGVVVDLNRYLMARADGKSPEESAKSASEVTVEDTHVSVPGIVDVKVRSKEEPAGLRVRALLVTEKGWLSKITAGHELYVICDMNEPAVISTIELSRQLGKTVQVTGRVFDKDGVRAISVQKLEAPPPPK